MNRIVLRIFLIAIGYPIAYIILKSIFKKSIMFSVAHLMVILLLLVSADMLFVGQMGSIHAAWAMPLNFGLGALFFMIIKRKLTVPLNDSISQVLSISKGDLQFEVIKNDNGNEIGILNNSIYELKGSLNTIINEIRMNAGNLIQSSEYLSSVSDQLSLGAASQASNLEEISTTFEEIAATLTENREKARSTGEMSVHVRDEVISMINELQRVMKTYEEISNKISGVNDISFQTNILALNAAVEAARAGKYGLGFSVVADEVGKLANASKVLSSEIESLSRINKNEVAKTEKNIAALVPEVEISTNYVQDIVRMNLEQENGISHINHAIQQLNGVTQQNAAASEEMASNAEELAAQAENLSGLISFFKL